jgi:hypothetical protein
MSHSSFKTFNTDGPCEPYEHYLLPAVPRQSAVEGLIQDACYFTLHAPRQSGIWINKCTDFNDLACSRGKEEVQNQIGKIFETCLTKSLGEENKKEKPKPTTNLTR